MSGWRYKFAQAISDADLGELQLTNTSFESLIIVDGAFKATLPVPNADVARVAKKVVPSLATDPRSGEIVTVPQSICHVYDGGDLWDSYLIWVADRTVQGKGRVSIDLQGASIGSWWSHRLMDSDLTLTATDQIEIARQLIANSQIGWGTFAGNANLSIATQGGNSGVLRDRTYLTTEGAMVGQRLSELANVDGGFEYRTIVFLDNGIRKRLWTWGYPNLGSDSVNHSYEMPGNLTMLREVTDLTEGATAHWARGDTAQGDLTADSQPTMTAAPWVRSDLLARLWPWTDSVTDHQGVTALPTLDDYAKFYAASKGGAVSTLTARVAVPNDPDGRKTALFRPSRLGDRVALVERSLWWPLDDAGRPTYSPTPRCVGVKVTPRAKQTAGLDMLDLVLADDSIPALVEEA